MDYRLSCISAIALSHRRLLRSHLDYAISENAMPAGCICNNIFLAVLSNIELVVQIRDMLLIQIILAIQFACKKSLFCQLVW